MKRILALISTICICLFCIPAIHSSAEPSTPAFVVEKVSGYAGDKVTVKITTENNPGVAYIRLLISYNSQVLKLLSASDGTIMTGASFVPGNDPTKNPYALTWASLENKTADGLLASLTFEILDEAALGESAVTLSYDPEDVFDVEFNNVPFTIQNGSVTVECDHVAGDWETQKPAACEEEGQEVKKCTKCQEVLEIRPIPATGHKWKETGRTEADCANAGSISYICENDPTHTKQETIDALGQDWEAEREVDEDPT